MSEQVSDLMVRLEEVERGFRIRLALVQSLRAVAWFALPFGAMVSLGASPTTAARVSVFPFVAASLVVTVSYVAAATFKQVEINEIRAKYENMSIRHLRGVLERKEQEHERT